MPLFKIKLRVLVISACAVMAGCGGGGGGSTGPSAQAGDVDLNDAATAIKISSVLLGSTDRNWNFFASLPWSTTDFVIRSSETSVGCFTDTYFNDDGVPSAGDKAQFKDTNCAIQETSVGINRTRTGTSTFTLSSISNNQTPSLAAWTASVEAQDAFTSQWDVGVTSNNIKFVGSGNTNSTMSLLVNHAADGTQAEQFATQIAFTGTENGLPFDLTAKGNFVCNYANVATHSSFTSCHTSLATLKGQYSGKAVNASMTQAPVDKSKEQMTFTITQGAQTMQVQFAAGSSVSVTQPNGAVLLMRAANLAFSSGYQ